MDASEVTDLLVIGYEVSSVTPLILSNCQYQVVQGGENLQECNLEQIQRQITSRFLQGKPKLTLKGLPTLVYRRDWNYEQLFAGIRNKMPQVSASSAPQPGDLPSGGLPSAQAAPPPGVSVP